MSYLATQHLVILCAGQSNEVAKLTSTGGVGNNPPYLVSRNARIRILKYSGRVYPKDWVTPLVEPYADTTGAIDGSQHANRQSVDPLASLGAASGAVELANCILDGGFPAGTFTPFAGNILLVPCALAQSFVAAQWKDSGGYKTEPCNATLTGLLKQRLRWAAQLPNPRFLIDFSNGESESDDLTNATATAYAADMGAVLDDINNFVATDPYVSSRGTWWKSSAHFLLTQLSAGYANPPLSWPWTGIVRSGITGLVSRGDTLAVQDSFAGGWTHRNHDEQISIGRAKANAVIPAS